ncbi:MAG: DnaJ domain-containing protein [Bacteroidota bacterium]
MKKYYQILGLPENASIDSIKRNYRKLAFHYHPDRNSSGEAREKFLLIQEAYEVLTGKKKVQQPKVGDYSNRRSRTDDSWEEKVKKARAKYEENKEYQEKAIANYFKKLRSGWRWKLNKVSSIVGIVLALCMFLDLILPNHRSKENVERYSKQVYSSISNAQISLIETSRLEKLWVQTQNYGLYKNNREVIVIRSWILHAPIKIISIQKHMQYQIPVHFTFFWAWMFVIPLFCLPLLVWMYKKNDSLFVITYHASVFIISLGVFYFLFTEDRWFHVLTLGFY